MTNKTKGKYFKDLKLKTRLKFRLLKIKLKLCHKFKLYERFDITCKKILKVLDND